MTLLQAVLSYTAFAAGAIFGSNKNYAPTGTWSGSKGGINFRFVFNDNGSYTYSASEGNDPIIEHRKIQRFAHRGSRMAIQYFVDTSPSTLKTYNQEGLRQMRQLMLFDDKQREYRDDRYPGTRGQPALQF